MSGVEKKSQSWRKSGKKLVINYHKDQESDPSKKNPN